MFFKWVAPLKQKANVVYKKLIYFFSRVLSSELTSWAASFSCWQEQTGWWELCRRIDLVWRKHSEISQSCGNTWIFLIDRTLLFQVC